MKIIYNDGHVAECPEEEELEVLRHSAAHIMAQAVKRIYPQAHFAYGPATEKGFHYDIDLGDVHLTDEDLPAIEAEMQKIVIRQPDVSQIDIVVESFLRGGTVRKMSVRIEPLHGLRHNMRS